MSAMIPIYTQTVGAGGAISVTFNNIPQIYTDLKIVQSIRGTNAGINESTFMRFNNDDGNNYSSIRILGNGSVSSGQETISYVNTLSGSGGNSTANTFGSAEFYIPNYTSSNFKQVILDAVGENNSATNDAYRLTMSASLWRSSSAITRILLQSFSGSNLAQHSTFSLYGIIRSGA